MRRLLEVMHEAYKNVAAHGVIHAFEDTDKLPELAPAQNSFASQAYQAALDGMPIQDTVASNRISQLGGLLQKLGLASMALDALGAGRSQAVGAAVNALSATVNAAYEEGYGTVSQMIDPRAEIVWHTEDDPCDLCASRDGVRYAMQDLPGWPGDGSFGDLCEGGPNCRCSLTYEYNNRPLETGINSLRDLYGPFGQQEVPTGTEMPWLPEQQDQWFAERQAFTDTLPDGARERAQARDSIRYSLAVDRSVHPADIPASDVAALIPPALKIFKRAKDDLYPRPIAAGIIVVRGDTGQVLMDKRRINDSTDPDVWEFPGGHLKDGESIRDGAIREWQEETGLILAGGEFVASYRDEKYQAFVYVLPGAPTEKMLGAEILKYDEDEARDSHGRWTSGGGETHASESSEFSFTQALNNSFHAQKIGKHIEGKIKEALGEGFGVDLKNVGSTKSGPKGYQRTLTFRLYHAYDDFGNVLVVLGESGAIVKSGALNGNSSLLPGEKEQIQAATVAARTEVGRISVSDPPSPGTGREPEAGRQVESPKTEVTQRPENSQQSVGANSPTGQQYLGGTPSQIHDAETRIAQLQATNKLVGPIAPFPIRPETAIAMTNSIESAHPYIRMPVKIDEMAGGVKGVPVNSYAYTYPISTGGVGRIYLNKSLFSSRQALGTSIRQHLRTGWFPAEASSEPETSILDHELGHIVNGEMIKILADGSSRAAQQRAGTLTRNILQKGGFGRGPADWAKISGYSASDPMEAFAEQWSVEMQRSRDGAGPTPLIDQAVKILKITKGKG